jgi:glycerol-1-phosphate dehydrogenase [NAD(P)+]
MVTVGTELELFDALGAEVAGALSARRDSLPRRMLLGRDAPARLAEELTKETLGRRAAVLFDARTRQAAGDRCIAALAAAGFDVHAQLLPDVDGHSPVCDDVTHASLAAALPQCDALVGVGSGVIGDLTKWIAFDRKLPSAVFATAASMNGYAAANVAPAVGGVKTLVLARAHRLIAADPGVLARAPAALTSAGLGDVIAKTVSTADWKMNDLLFGEDFNPAIAGIIDEVEQKFLSDPSKLARADEAAVSGLFEALVYSGCAMTLQGSSLPASGGEHLISHALDMRAVAEGVEHDLHGRQVGLGTIFAAALYERVLGLTQARFSGAPLPLDRAGWGGIADSVAEHHQKQSARLAESCTRLSRADTWTHVRAALLPMLPSAAWIKDVLRQAGAAHRIADLGIDRERFTWAVLNGAQMRERFTSLDLAWATGVLPGAADEIIERYLLT